MDASKTETGIGLRLVVAYYNGTHRFQLNIQNNIYTAEYVALLKGIQTAINSIDLHSILSNLNNSIQTDSLVIKISNLIHYFNKHKCFIWILGHSKIKRKKKQIKQPGSLLINPELIHFHCHYFMEFLIVPSNRKQIKRNKTLSQILAKTQKLKQKRRSHTKQIQNWSYESITWIPDGKN